MPGKSIGDMRTSGEVKNRAGEYISNGAGSTAGQSDKDYMDKAVKDTPRIINAYNEGDKDARAFTANLSRSAKKPVRRTTSRSGGR